MPLRDHFRPPLSNRRSWDMLHGGWPMTIVQRLFPLLPEGYFAGPGVYLTHPYEVDVAAFDADESSDGGSNAAGDGGVAVATRTTQAPTLTVESEWPDQDEYEVRIHDERRAGRLARGWRPTTKNASPPKLNEKCGLSGSGLTRAS